MSYKSLSERIREKLQKTYRKNDKTSKDLRNYYDSDKPLNLAHSLKPKAFANLVKITQDLAAAVSCIKNKTSLPKKPKKPERSL